MSTVKQAQMVTPSIKQSVVTGYVNKTNSVIREIRKKHSKLFDIVREAYGALEGDRKALRSYTNQVEIEKSTLNKIYKICANNVVMSNIENLMISWASLYELTKFPQEKLAELIEDQVIVKSTTQKEVKEIYKEILATKNSNAQTTKVVASNIVPVRGRVISSSIVSGPVANCEMSVCSANLDLLTFDVSEVKEDDRANVDRLITQLEALGVRSVNLEIPTAA